MPGAIAPAVAGVSSSSSASSVQVGGAAQRPVPTSQALPLEQPVVAQPGSHAPVLALQTVAGGLHSASAVQNEPLGSQRPELALQIVAPVHWTPPVCPQPGTHWP